MRAIRFWACSLVSLTFAVASAAEAPKLSWKRPSAVRATADFAEPAVVVVALSPPGMMDDAQGEEVQRAQIEIATKAAAVSPVVLLVPNAEMKLDVLEHCKHLSEQICEGLASDRIRVEVGRHQSPWIRDYGPQFATTASGEPILLDARYHDVRNDVRRREKLIEINMKRYRDLQMFPQARAEAAEAARQALGEKLRELYRELQQNEAHEEGEPEHAEDEVAPELEGEDSPQPAHDDRETAAADDPADEPAAEASPANGTDATEAEEDEPENEDTAQVSSAEDDEAPSDTPDNKADDFSDLFDDEEEDDVEEGDEARRLQQFVEAREKEAQASLAYHNALYEVIEKHSGTRGVDDESPLAVGIAVFSDVRFNLHRPEINLDGGNFLRASDGRCLTTRDLLTRNFGREDELRRVLTEEYGCAPGIVFLRALPGGDGVIEHVDMFALPVPGKRIFVASYTPDNPIMARYWNELSPSMKRLATEAAITMKANARTLRELGYDVIEIPSPLPRKTMDDQLYYPTILNGILHTNGTTSQLLLPRYDGYQEDLQRASFDKIREVIGTETLFDTIESTASAQGQGAVHCLTILIPEKWTVFASRAEREARELVLAALEAIGPMTVAAKEADRLEGVWHIHGPEGDVGLFDAEEMKLVFRGTHVRLKFGKSTEHDTTFNVSKRDGRRWTLDIRGKETMKIEWEGSDRFQILRDDDVPLTAVRR